MPLYEVHHIIPLTDSQTDELAQAITHLHSTRFTTPTLFVNVKFIPTPSTAVSYVGGRRSKGNMIIANVRVGSRTQEDWDALSQDVVAAWNQIVPMPLAKGQGHKSVDYELRTFFIQGELVGGWEAGFLIPKAGGDVQWMERHWDEFEEKAKGGDEDFQLLIKEVRERGLMKGKGN